MALIHSKQLNPKLTGSFTLSGSLGVEGSVTPQSDDTYDLGAVGNEWNDLFIDGTANIDTLSLTDGFTYGGVTFNENSNALSVTGSKFELKATDSSDLFTVFNNSDEISVQFDDKVIVLGAKTGATPTPVAGGLFYSGSDEWFLGYEN